MTTKIKIRCLNDLKTYSIDEGTTLMELSALAAPPGMGRIVAAKVNNVPRALSQRLYNNADVEFADISSSFGMRTYVRTLTFILGKAISNLYDGISFSVEAPVSNGYYISLRNEAGRCGQQHAFRADAAEIKHEMDAIIQSDIPFERVVCPTDEAIAVFSRHGMESKVKLLNSIGRLYTEYYTLDGYPDNYYGALCPSTGFIALYGLENYNEGLLLRLPDPKNAGELKPMVRQDKMLDIFNEHHRWQNLVCLRTVGEMNDLCAKGHADMLIHVSEALQEKKICHIAEEIEQRKLTKLVLIAGPSSSGKTTFSKRLSVQLMTCGLRPRSVSLDDYFLPRVQTPLDENGEYDYETIDALNLPLLAEHLQQLFEGKEVELPRYDFQTGESGLSGNRMKLELNDILVIEGIHALNPKLTAAIDDKYKYKVYVSALTTIQLDDHNYIPTTDNRLLRRIVRDAKFRGSSAADTIARWPSVRAGEEKWIFPYQENVDAMFNSALLFELAGLRTQALPLLEMVPENAPEYAEAYRLRKFLRYINPIDTATLPQASLLREFLGGSSFRY